MFKFGLYVSSKAGMGVSRRAMREEGGRKVDWRKKMMEAREGKRMLCVVCALSTTEQNHVIVEARVRSYVQ